MAIFLGSRSLLTLMELQSRALLISSCFGSKRRFGSSTPVRYIPKDNQIKKAQNYRLLESPAEKERTSIERKVSKSGKGAGEVPHFDHNEFRDKPFCAEIMNSSDIFEQVEEFSELKDATGAALGLVDTYSRNNSGHFLDETSNSLGHNSSDRKEVIGNKIWEDAEKMSIQLLAARAFTAVELQKKLRGKKYPLNVVEQVIANMKCRGLLNDGLYAETFSRSRWLSSTWGPRRIKQALIQKGVSEVEVYKAAKLVFEEDDRPGEGCNDYMQHGMSKLSTERLFVQASKQWLRGQGTSLENRRSRMVRWLQYRGFNWGVTNLVLKKLESQYPP